MCDYFGSEHIGLKADDSLTNMRKLFFSLVFSFCLPIKTLCLVVTNKFNLFIFPFDRSSFLRIVFMEFWKVIFRKCHQKGSLEWIACLVFHESVSWINDVFFLQTFENKLFILKWMNSLLRRKFRAIWLHFRWLIGIEINFIVFFFIFFNDRECQLWQRQVQRSSSMFKRFDNTSAKMHLMQFQVSTKKDATGLLKQKFSVVFLFSLEEKCNVFLKLLFQGQRSAFIKICGVNNKSYHSWCQMMRDSCNTGYFIDIKHNGMCHNTTMRI